MYIFCCYLYTFDFSRTCPRIAVLADLVECAEDTHQEPATLTYIRKARVWTCVCVCVCVCAHVCVCARAHACEWLWKFSLASVCVCINAFVCVNHCYYYYYYYYHLSPRTLATTADQSGWYQYRSEWGQYAVPPVMYNTTNFHLKWILLNEE